MLKPPCLQAAVSRALPFRSSDDEDRVALYAGNLRPTWNSVLEAIRNSLPIHFVSPNGETKFVIRDSCVTRGCDDFAFFALQGYSFHIEHMCGKKKIIGPAVSRPVF